jgi:hypothetical protein
MSADAAKCVALEEELAAVRKELAEVRGEAKGGPQNTDDSPKGVILEKMKGIRQEIYDRENEINRRSQEIKAWKSKASQLDARAAEERSTGRPQKSAKLAELARDKADVLADQNSDSWIVIEGLKAELNDLERLEKNQ